MSTTDRKSDEPALRQSIGATGVPLPTCARAALPEVFGRYRIASQLGRGAMGAVYLAQDTQLSRQVAIKVPHFNGEGSDELLERFYREARSASTLRSPYICPVYDVGEIQGQHYISMAYIEGKPLSELVKTGGPQKERAVLLLIRKLALALQEAHAAGVVHRDLKPANIMIDPRGEPVIMDFGLAFQEDRTRLTNSGAILGSPAYMSPEQLDGTASALTAASDQFSLGVVLFELLTGELPFRGSISAVANQIVNSPPPSLRKLRPELDRRTEELCLKLLAKRPNARFGSMKEVADHIGTVLKAESTASPKDPSSTPAASPIGDSDPGANTFQGQVLKLLEWGELVSALELLERPDANLSGKDAEWVRLQRAEVRQQIEHWKTESPALCLLAAKLISKHDYAEAAKQLSIVPVGVRSVELNKLLEEAQEKDEEVVQLLKDIEKVFRAGTADELKWLIKRFLQLKPGHRQMRALAEDLRRFGPEQVIRHRRSRRNFLDPAGQVWDAKHIAYYVAGVALACTALYAVTVAFQSPVGKVTIEVLDPAIEIDFSGGEITSATPGHSFRLPAGEKRVLTVKLGGRLIPDATQEVSVERNETKLIQASVVDGAVQLAISSEKKIFAAPRNDPDVIPPDQHGPFAATSGASISEWTDLLAAVDPAKSGGSIMAWNTIDNVLTGTVKPPAKEAWVSLTPALEFTGDYDLEADFKVFGSSYVSASFPLNETNVALSMSPSGSGLHWIDGKNLRDALTTAPHGQSNAVIKPGQLQRLAISVRHHAGNVTVKTVLDGRPSGEFSGLRSRLTIPADAIPAPRKFRIVSHIVNPTVMSRFELHRARLRRLSPGAGSTASPALAATPPIPVSQTPVTPPADSQNLIIDADFRTSRGGFNDADQDWILEEHKNGEFRYLGKKPGWWYSPFHGAFWAKENNRLKDFAVEFDIRVANRNKGEFAIQFGRLGDDRLSLCVNQTGRIRLLRGGDELVPPVQPSGVRTGDQFNAVRMAVEGQTIKVSMNGAPVLEKKVDHLGASFVAAWLYVEDYPFDVRLQRFRLERIGKRESRAIDAPIRTFVGHQDTIRGVAFLPDGKQAVSVGSDFAFKLWNVENGQLVHDFAGHGDAVTSVSVSADGSRAVTGCDDSHVRLWDLENRTLLKTLKGHTAPVSSVLISKEGTTAFSASHDGSIRRWNLKSNAKPAVLPGPGGEATLIFSPDESLVACSALDGSVVMRGLKAAGLLTGHDPGPIRGMSFTPDGSKLVAAGCLGTVCVWDVANGKKVHTFDSGDAGFASVAVTSDGRYVIAGCRDHTIRSWDLETGDAVAQLTTDMPVTYRLALSPDNRLVLSGGGSGGSSNDFALRLWQRPGPPAKR